MEDQISFRTLFADDEAPQRGSEKHRIWWNDDQDEWDESPRWEDWNFYGCRDDAYWDEPDYYAEWNDYGEEWQEVQWSNEEALGEEDTPIDENAQPPEGGDSVQRGTCLGG